MNNDFLIKELRAVRVLKTPRIIEAFQKIDRADFVRAEERAQAYANTPLPIGQKQTISQPFTVAFMLELLQPCPGEKILDIGAGSGWQTALLAEIVGETGKVFAIELLAELFAFGKNNVSKYDFIKNGVVKFYCQNAQDGLFAEAPFDKIISAAASDAVPPAWKKQLKIGGRLILPVDGSLRLIVKKTENDFEEFIYPGFTFVPFINN